MQTQAKIRVGDYFYTSWGYDQTNIDYLIVVGISPSGKTARCRMVSPIHVGSQGTDDILMPGTPTGPEFQMKVRAIGDRLSLRGSYPYIHSLPNERRLDSFLPTQWETHRQTQSQFGH